MKGFLTQERFDSAYFPSFEALNMEFNQRIAEYHTHFSVYRVPKMALYFLWHGINREHLAEIKKHHLRKDGIYNPVTDRLFSVPEDVMVEIINMADFSLGNPEIVVSNYALRTRMSGKMTTTTIRSTITHFNAMTDHSSQGGFQMLPVFESGLFNRVRDMELAGYEFPIYRKNRRLSDEGLKEYEHLFQRKFSSIKTLSTYIVKYRDYIEYYKK